MDILKSYINIQENTETLYSIIIYDTKSKDVIDYIEEQLDKAKKISNPIKKNKISDRLFKFLKYIQDNYEENNNINSIFLISDNIFKYYLSDSEINTAYTYNLHKIYVKVDTKFCIDFIIDFFCNFDFIYSIKLNKNEMFIIKLNKNKEKQLENTKISNEQKLLEEVGKIRKVYNYLDTIIIYGDSPLLKKEIEQNNVLIHKELINRSGVYKLYENENMKKNHILLEKKLLEMKNEKTNLDLYVFGKLKNEIKTEIELYSIKELYIERKKLEKLKTIVDESYLNFKIIEIASLENGDIADQFIKDYNGIMALKYYAL